MSSRYNPKEIEPKWQKIWQENGVYNADLDSKKPKYLAMSMFNYPSGAGIHIGHAMNYTISDVKARFKRQQGYESYHPVGWDAFGLPAENYAIKAGVSPQASMAKIIPEYHKQYKAMGWSNDWSKEISTHEPEYYKWTQWIFSKMYKHGLAYQDARLQWWCNKCQTVLANEQIINGKCWRHDGLDDPIIEKKEVKQWFFKITEYADELLEAIDDLDWTPSVKLAQKNWIGRSVGAEVDFALHKVANPNPEMARTYIMVQKNISQEDILSLGGITKRVADNGHLCVEFPVSKAKEFEELIIKKMEPGFWNEYLTNKEVVFIFKHKDNKIERFVLGEDNGHKICMLGNEFNGQPKPSEYETVWQWLENNSWYAPIVPKIKVFTTRPDTLFGATFLVLAPEHELIESLTIDKTRSKVKSYIKQALAKSEVERQECKDKTGVFTGSYAINPVNNKKVPIWIADYVLTGYGTGAIMAVPAHDERDNEFASKYDLPIINVVKNEESDLALTTNEGVMINSGDYDGMKSSDAREKIVKDLEQKGLAKSKVNYKMRDWSVSRQRYWGAPIPIVNCIKCGPVLVEDQDLPVKLPELTDFKPSGDGRSALARATDWLKVDCPKCGSSAERETDTLDTYICSSWYYLRYIDPHNSSKIFDTSRANKWIPVDFYNGGDHATAHLLYARFVTRFFNKLGLVDNPEPFKQMLFNGKIMAEDGSAFSKSKGNGIDPLEIINQGYGADALRMFLMFAAPLEFDARWNSQGVPATHRFLSRLWNLVQEYHEAEIAALTDSTTNEILRVTNKMVKVVTSDIEENRYNTAIAAAMGALNDLYKIKVKNLAKNEIWLQALTQIISVVAPFAPHIADELWQQLGYKTTVQKDSWPEWDNKYLEQLKVTVIIQINGKLKGRIEVDSGSSQAEVEKLAREDEKIASYLIKGVKKVIYISDKLINFVV